MKLKNRDISDQLIFVEGINLHRRSFVSRKLMADVGERLRARRNQGIGDKEEHPGNG